MTERIEELANSNSEKLTNFLRELVGIPSTTGMEGNVIELDFGQWKIGENAPLRIHLALHYYKLDMANQVLVEIDVDNRLRKINGIDQVGVLKGITGFQDAI